MDRSKTIIRTSFLGIGVNLVLVLFKMIVGLLSGSVAIILDAVNNLSDALSSAITILGAKLSARKPDKRHPYGYGRIEYLVSVVIAVIVLLAGVAAAKESVEKILHPSAAEYSTVMLLVIAVAVVVKYLFGRYVRSIGHRVQANSLVASGADAQNDALVSLGTLAGALVSIFLHWNIEGYIGLVIALLIIKSVVELLIEALDTVIGTRTDAELAGKIKQAIRSFEGVGDVFDLTLNYYGPTQIIGSAHIEVADTMDARQLHRLTRAISTRIFSEFGVILTVGIYARNDSSEPSASIRSTLEQICAQYPEVQQMHGFYCDEKEKHVMFDLIVSFGTDEKAIESKVVEMMKAAYPAYHFDPILDSDFSD